MTGVVTLSMYVSGFATSSTRDTDSNRVMALSIWMLFVVVNAYYGGAMTMFFTSTISLDLETKRDVLQAYPQWHLIFLNGSESRTIYEYSTQGDADHVEYQARDEADPTKTRFQTYEEGLKRIEINNEIMYMKESDLMGWLRSNPHHVQVNKFQPFMTYRGGGDLHPYLRSLAYGLGGR